MHVHVYVYVYVYVCMCMCVWGGRGDWPGTWQRSGRVPWGRGRPPPPPPPGRTPLVSQDHRLQAALQTRAPGNAVAAQVKVLGRGACFGGRGCSRLRQRTLTAKRARTPTRTHTAPREAPPPPKNKINNKII